MRVAVLAGGRSSEHDVSLASGEGVRKGLGEAGHEVLDVRIARDGTWTCAEEELVLAPGRGLLAADAAFPVLHGPFGEDGTLQGLLECLDVPYVGAGVMSSALCMDKVLFKELMGEAGLPQVAWVAARAREWREHPEEVLARVADLPGPVFVKPARLGSSVGIGRAAEPAEAEEALDAAFAHDALVIVEQAAFGGEAVEVEISALGNGDPEVSEPGEIVLAGDWYDFAAKYTPGGMELRVPAGISHRARDRVRELAREAFRRAGCAGLARVDFFVRGDEVLLNELNTMPGQTPTSVYGKLWAASGRPYPAVLDRLVTLALERHAAARAFAS